MAIIKKDVYFGEGISDHGQADAIGAFKDHRKSIRTQRLNDLLGKDAKLHNYEIERKFEEIRAALEAADKQVVNDNQEFMTQHGIAI